MRTAGELEQEGAVDGSLHIPLTELPCRLREVPPDRSDACVPPRPEPYPPLPDSAIPDQPDRHGGTVEQARADTIWPAIN